MDSRHTVQRSALVMVMLLAPVFAMPGALTTDGPWWWPTQAPWVETQELTPGDIVDPSSFLRFGSKVAIDRDTLVVSTQFDMFYDNSDCDDFGYSDGCDWVYVYNRDQDGQWVQSAKLVPDDARPLDTFGYAVALDEASGVIAVGNPGTRTEANKIYIFERQTDGSWTQTAKFHWDNPNPPAGALGRGIAVSGTTVAATAGHHPGQTFVYDKVEGHWQLTATLWGGGGLHGVDVAGDRIVTMAAIYNEGCGGRHNTYLFQVHDRVNGVWITGDLLDPSAGYSASSTIGTRFALNEDGDVLVIGVPIDRRVMGLNTAYCASLGTQTPVGPVSFEYDYEYGAAGAAGSAWVYEYSDGVWTRTADIPNPTPNQGLAVGSSVFGASVAASGNRIVVGADCDFYNSGPCSGAAFVYEKLAEDWILTGKLRNRNSESGDWFGHSVGISESTVVAGGHYTSYTGSAHTFERTLFPW